MKERFNHNITGDDLLFVRRTTFGDKQFYTAMSEGGRLPDTRFVASRIAMAWNAVQGMSNEELELLAPGCVKRHFGTPVAPVVIDVTDYKIVEVAETTS